MKEFPTSQCDKCPHLALVRQHWLEDRAELDGLAEDYEPSVVKERLAEIAGSLSSMGAPEELVRGLVSDENITNTCVGAIETGMEIEAHLDKMVEATEAHTENCPGPMIMRATSFGVTYQVQICRSPLQPKGGTPSSELANVTRTPIQ